MDKITFINLDLVDYKDNINKLIKKCDNDIRLNKQEHREIQH
jgi:hypothetical protein